MSSSLLVGVSFVAHEAHLHVGVSSAALVALLVLVGLLVAIKALTFAQVLFTVFASHDL
jgi:xanthosine utilization system XapX-like protein